MAVGVVGVDIGSTLLRGVEIDDASKANPTVLRAHEVPLPEGSVKRGEILEVHTVASAFKRLWAAGGFRSKDVALGIGGQSVIVRDLAVPRMPLAQIRESLPFQVQDLLPVPVSDAVLDYYPIGEGQNESGPVVNGLLVAAFKQAVTVNVTAATLAGLNPVSMDLLPFAMTRVHSMSGPTNGYAVHMNIGANATSIVIVQAGVPQFVRIVPAGGDDATRALMSRLSVPRERAEALKRELGLTSAGSTDEDRVAAEVIHESTSELLTAVRNTLAYFAGVRTGVVFDHLSVAGGATRMRGFASALAESTRISVVPVNPTAGVTISRALRGKTTDEQMQTWITSIGLAVGSAA
ncbi:type IV pilus assembly protein PilM [Microcella humidisoli]|uniref:Type IV pilus assembly protein PilM n=1 Tax=Microcella humidisoli TaxID=2963406 RepID=A0ABY5FSY8_9MICO|nr:type IV pilus assembly protein PilM [Microcella humidisoli]UTT61348.1 type IV pilus assembly protein PilM [Microcella humidisoli]